MAFVDIRQQFQHLMSLYVAIGVGVFLIVVGLMAFVVVRFRARPGRVSSPRSDAPRLELVYVAVLAAIVVVLLAATYSTESSVDAVAASPALRIDAIASDWRWRFVYPGQGISEVGDGEIPTDLYVPAGETVEFDLSSLDVLHAFYLPYERFQRQATPMLTSRFDLVFPTPGVQTSGYCNEFCGIGHTQMRFEVHVLTPQAFAAWVAQQRREGGTR
jgi:cytochrome c oxidase subunit 2